MNAALISAATIVVTGAGYAAGWSRLTLAALGVVGWVVASQGWSRAGRLSIRVERLRSMFREMEGSHHA